MAAPPIGPIIQIAEELRRAQAAGGDDKFLTSNLFFFEMKVPPSVTNAGSQSFIYPMVLSPDEYRMSEPFAVDKSFTTGSGLFVEENGIIAREITISGNTGWRPRKFPGKVVGASDLISTNTEGKSYSRNLIFNVIEALSGQRHFQFLQDVVLRTYGDLKRNPASSVGTELFFHNRKMEESWRVIPLAFDTEQRAGSLLTRYTIRLLAVEGAASATVPPSEDADVMKAIKDANLMIHSAVGVINGALLDLSGTQSELRTNLTGIGTILDDVSTVVDAAGAFLGGTASFITSAGNVAGTPLTFAASTVRTAIGVPYAFVQATISGIERVLQAYQDLLDLGSSETVPGSALNLLRQVYDGLHVIAGYPEQFQTSLDAAIDSFQKEQELATRPLNVRERPSVAQLLRDLDQGGSSPGEAVRRSSELGLGRNVPRYTSAIQRIIEGGDTLPNLASRYLGDAKRWKFIALLNDLRPPYISELRLPFTLRIGDPVLIPSFDRPQRQRGPLVTLGVAPDADLTDQLLGTDYALEETEPGSGFYCWIEDVEGGSVDAKLVSGVANLSQGLRSRMITSKGTDVLFREVGVERVVGLGLTAIDISAVQLRVTACLQADPRVLAVRRIEAKSGQNGSPYDALLIDADVEVRGLNRSEKIVQRVS